MKKILGLGIKLSGKTGGGAAKTEANLKVTITRKNKKPD